MKTAFSIRSALIVFAMFLSACSYKNEPIYLQPYQANAIVPILKEKKTLHIRGVNDQRVQKQTIGYVLENDNKKIILSSNEHFAKKYHDALTYALSVAEFNTHVSPQDAQLIVDVNIKNIEIQGFDKNFDENLKGEVAVELVVTQKSKITRYNLASKAGKWIAPSRSSKDLEPFLSELFEDSIQAVVTQLAKK